MPTERQVRFQEFLQSKADGTLFTRESLLQATGYARGTMMNMFCQTPGISWVGGRLYRYTPDSALQCPAATEEPGSLLPIGMLDPAVLQEHNAAMEQTVDRLLRPKRKKSPLFDLFDDFVESQIINAYNGVLRASDGSRRNRVTGRMG